MSASTEEAADLGYLAEATGRATFAGKVLKVLRQESPGRPQAFDPLARVLADVPRLVELARRGLLDRALIRQRAGQQERCATVQELHEPVETLAGLVVCAHCSELAGRPIPYACPTIARHDG